MTNIIMQRHHGTDTSKQSYAASSSFGSQLIVNGTFPANVTAGWTNISTGTGTVTWKSAGVVWLTYVDASDLGGLRQGPVSIPEGTPCLLTVINGSGATGTVKLGSTAAGTQYGTLSLPAGGGTTTLAFVITGWLLYTDVIAASGGSSPLVLNSISITKAD